VIPYEVTYHERGQPLTEATVRLIGRFVREGSVDPDFRAHVLAALRRAGVPPHAHGDELRALYDWELETIEYRKDPSFGEYVHTVQRLLEQRAGDCDDLVVFLGAAAASVGMRVRFVTVAWQSDGPDRHIYLLVQPHDDEDWIPVDPTDPSRVPYGEHPSGATRRTVWDTGGNVLNRVSLSGGSKMGTMDLGSLREGLYGLGLLGANDDDEDRPWEDESRTGAGRAVQRVLYERRRAHMVADPAAAALFPKWAEFGKRLKSGATAAYGRGDAAAPEAEEVTDGLGRRRRRRRNPRREDRAARRAARRAAHARRQAERQERRRRLQASGHTERHAERRERRLERRQQRQEAHRARQAARQADRLARQEARRARHLEAQAERATEHAERVRLRQEARTAHTEARTQARMARELDRQADAMDQEQGAPEPDETSAPAAGAAEAGEGDYGDEEAAEAPDSAPARAAAAAPMTRAIRAARSTAPEPEAEPEEPDEGDEDGDEEDEGDEGEFEPEGDEESEGEGQNEDNTGAGGDDMDGFDDDYDEDEDDDYDDDDDDDDLTDGGLMTPGPWLDPNEAPGFLGDDDEGLQPDPDPEGLLDGVGCCMDLEEMMAGLRGLGLADTAPVAGPPYGLAEDLVPMWWAVNNQVNRSMEVYRDAGFPVEARDTLTPLSARTGRWLYTVPDDARDRDAWGREANALLAEWEVIEVTYSGAAAAHEKKLADARAAVEEARPKAPDEPSFPGTIWKDVKPWLFGIGLALVGFKLLT
jgi:hypothetical protein